ncbi:MAG: hypothetical protein WHU94_07740 [Thermogemmata sp.]|uniref:Uncharacterized protein n=1 Tax=Thermogemmata fonticola TaxID=2755323 RepID=A0A7V8VD41_9BACT|nr:hypothetical protein [Thermogemmata fonticola]MBA2225746.1 hypothetical protein [Thermogemmata fonticola]MCX8138916.1 hypothetical protein [Gemmataceae bacterium]
MLTNVWWATVITVGHVIAPANGNSHGTMADAPYGFLYAPAFSLHAELRYPASRYTPQAGDVLLMSDTDCFWTLMYRLAFTGAPGHAGLVVPLPDGRLGVLEAGYNETLWTRITPLAERLREYPGMIWVRRRCIPLTPQQQYRLMEFALAAADKPYASVRVALQVTPLRTRGPLRTFVMGRPRGPGRRYQCAEAVVEALVYAGLRDPRTARPSATYPQDLFYDRSWNRYLDRHPPLGEDWEPPALWTPVLGWALKGRTRAALIASGILPSSDTKPLGNATESANALESSGGSRTLSGRVDGIQPCAGSSEPVPVQGCVLLVGRKTQAITYVEQPLKHVGVFDRPPRLGRRR